MKDNYKLYTSILGQEWNKISETVKRGFSGEGSRRGKGIFTFRRGRSVLSRFICWIEGLPDETDGVETDILMVPSDGSEIWLRKFGTKIFRTVQREKEGLLVEHFGILEFYFRLMVDGGGIIFVQEKLTWEVSILHFTIPRWIAPRVEAWAWETKHSDKSMIGVKVVVKSPLTGLIWSYEGALEIK